MITRRGLITGMASLFVAPAIVRASSIMAIKPLPLVVEPEYVWREYHIGFRIFKEDIGSLFSTNMIRELERKYVAHRGRGPQ